MYTQETSSDQFHFLSVSDKNGGHAENKSAHFSHARLSRELTCRALTESRMMTGPSASGRQWTVRCQLSASSVTGSQPSRLLRIPLRSHAGIGNIRAFEYHDT